MKKRLLSLLLCTALTLALLPATALADDIVTPGFDYDNSSPDVVETVVPSNLHSLVIAYEDCTHVNPATSDSCHVMAVSGFATSPRDTVSGPGWTYDPASYTLALNGFRGTGIYFKGAYSTDTEHKTPTVTVKLTGESVITSAENSSASALLAGQANLVLSGAGTLTLSGGGYGLQSSSNNGDYKAGTLGGGLVSLTGGAKLYAKNCTISPLLAKQLTVGAGCLVDLDGSGLNLAGSVDSLVVNGTLVARCDPAKAYTTAIATLMYCTAGANVTIKAGADANSASTTLKTKAPRTSPIYGAVTVLDYDAGDGKPLPYIEFREGGSTAPTAPTAPMAPAGKTAHVQNQTITVDGKPIAFQTYALKDAAGNLTNYVKLRDVAHVLNGTAVQFEVAWDGSVNIQTGKSYTSNGSEMKTPFSGDRAYADATAPTKVNGQVASLAAITLTDDNGAGYTYYKLRDLGEALGFQVDWSATEGITVNTGA